MALARLGGNRRAENYTWPGFVDALATLLMVIIFVLLVFVLIQVNLAYRVAGQDATMNDMRAQIVNLGDLLNLERKANEDLSAELASISNQLVDASRQRDSLIAQLATTTATLGQRDNEVARLTALQEDTAGALATAQATLAADPPSPSALTGGTGPAERLVTSLQGNRIAFRHWLKANQ